MPKEKKEALRPINGSAAGRGALAGSLRCGARQQLQPATSSWEAAQEGPATGLYWLFIPQGCQTTGQTQR